MKATSQGKSASWSSIIICPCPIAIPGRSECSRFLRFFTGLDTMSLFSPITLRISLPYADELRKRGIEVVHHPHTKTVRDYLQHDGRNL